MESSYCSKSSQAGDIKALGLGHHLNPNSVNFLSIHLQLSSYALMNLTLSGVT